MELVSVHDRATWNQAVLRLPRPHILQSWEWGAFKSRHGWSTAPWLLTDANGTPRAAALVLRRQLLRLPSGLPYIPKGLLYVPKGPLLDPTDLEAWDGILAHLERLARRQRAIFVKLDPDVSIERDRVTDLLKERRWRPSAEQIQFRNTMTLDLTQDEDTLLAEMKSKWRYNIRLAGRKGLTVRAGSMDDLSLLYDMYRETALRDSFVIRPFDYYRDAWGSFIESGLAHPLIAQMDDDPIAMLILFQFGATAWYMYGASRNRHRDKMPNHLLQWHAICWAKSNGCTIYDMWGAPDEPVESDPMWGVYRFKQGFGASMVQHIGAYDYAASRPWYWIYTALMPRILALMRRRHWGRVRDRLD